MKHVVTVLTLWLGLQFCAAAQTSSLGLFNSYKGFGIEYSRCVTPDEIQVFTAYADLACLFGAKDSDAGFKLSAQRRKIIAHADIFGLYYGTGLSLGYCSDNLVESSQQNRGLTAAFTLGIGSMIYLPGSFDLSVGFTLEGGAQLRRDETYDNLVMSWYLDGITRSLIPELTIYYKF